MIFTVKFEDAGRKFGVTGRKTRVVIIRQDVH